jgi:hypothetical protein
MSKHGRPDYEDVQGATRRAHSSMAKGNGSMRRERFRGVHLPDIRYEPGVQNWLIDHLLPAEGLAVLFGRWKSYKSFIALDLAMTVARGALWAGRKVKQGAVVYIAAEGALGLRKRIAAYQARYPGDQSPFYLTEARPSLGTRPGDKDELIAGIRATVGGPGVEIVLVVVDTLARTVGIADENNEGMRAFTDNCEDIADAFRCLALAVHHENAAGDARTRGGTSLPGAAVTIWRAKKVQDGEQRCCLVTIDDAKDSADGMALMVRFDVHEFGEPEPGSERESTLIVNSVVIEMAARDDAVDKVKGATRGIPKGQAAFMTAFEQALEKHGSRKLSHPEGPYVMAVNKERVRQRYYTIRADASAATKERSFNRQLAKAVEREDLVTREREGQILLWKPKTKPDK